MQLKNSPNISINFQMQFRHKDTNKNKILITFLKLSVTTLGNLKNKILEWI